MRFQKQDLEGTHYNWANGETDVFNGQPSRRTFDRFNGDQVLFLINYFGSLSAKFTLQDAKDIEQKILNDLPLAVKSEISVFNWIKSTVISVQ